MIADTLEKDIRAFRDTKDSADESAADRLIQQWARELNTAQPWLSADDIAELTFARYQRARTEAIRRVSDELRGAVQGLAAITLRFGLASAKEAKSGPTGLRLRAKQHSSNHRLFEAMATNKVVGRNGPLPENPNRADYFSRFVSIVPKHNWLEMLGDAILPEFDDEWKLPFDLCCFEYDIWDKQQTTHVATFIGEDAKGGIMSDFVEVDGVWSFMRMIQAPTLQGIRAACIEEAKGKGFKEPDAGTWTIDFIRACCIAIDCEGAEFEDVPASPKLNKARAERGKTPLRDYKVINVRNRPKPGHSRNGGEHSRGMRLHFRRGHWWPRKENRETRFDRFRHWRPWRLVGDPDLGYIEHEYRI